MQNEFPSVGAYVIVVGIDEYCGDTVTLDIQQIIPFINIDEASKYIDTNLKPIGLMGLMIDMKTAVINEH
jgi:hypothetical protein